MVHQLLHLSEVQKRLRFLLSNTRINDVFGIDHSCTDGDPDDLDISILSTFIPELKLFQQEVDGVMCVL